MPKAPRRCPTKGCHTLIRHTRYCPEHTPAWDTPSGWQAPAGWAKTRDQVLHRDSYRCHVCGGDGADTVDHLRPVAQGGRHTADNLAAIHDRNPPHCHRAKTNRDRQQPRPGRS
ncbi:HNH endonuclease [Nocardia tengchongensis]